MKKIESRRSESRPQRSAASVQIRLDTREATDRTRVIGAAAGRVEDRAEAGLYST